jgi:hypothetical protein
LTGTLAIIGNLTVNSEIDFSGGNLSFGSMTNAGVDIQGSGTVTSSGNLSNSSEIIGSGLSVSVASFTNLGTIIAVAPSGQGVSSLVLNVTGGAGAFTNLANGTLTGGTYEAIPGGTLEIDGVGPIVTDNAAIVLGNYSQPGLQGSTIKSSGVALENSLQTIGAAGSLTLHGDNYTAPGQLTVDGTVTLNAAAALSAAGLTIDATGQLSGAGTVTAPIVDNGTITSSAATGSSVLLLLNGSVNGTGTLLVNTGTVNSRFSSASSSTLELNGAVSNAVSFADGTGILRLDAPQSFTGTISALSGDKIVLSNIAISSVTSTSYAGGANGGTLTINEGSVTQTLRFAGNYNINSFSLTAGPQALSTLPPSLMIQVTPLPTAPTIGLSTSNSGMVAAAIINTATPTVTGTWGPGASLAFNANGVAEGSLTLISTTQSSTASYTATLTPALGLGAQQVNAVASNAAGSTQSAAPLNLFVLPAPVNGVTTAYVGSLDLSTLLGQGYTMQFAAGTEAVQLVNGTLSVGPDTNEAYTQRLYEGLLGRAGDSGGLTNNDQALTNGSNQTDLANGFLNSAEYQSLHGASDSMTDSQFVTSLYQGFLGRAPDPGGLAAYTAALGQGMTRAQAVVSIAQSAESKTYLAPDTANVWVQNTNGALVNDMFKTGLNRDADPSGLQTWTQQLQLGLGAAGLANQIASSAEFQADHAGQSATAYVTSLYQDGLGRAPDPSGLQNWVGAMQNGASQASVLLGIATSAEGQTHLSPSV